MRFLVGKSERAGETAELARRYLFETYKRDELRWRPWLITRQPVEGIERLHAAANSGHGVLVSFMHHAIYEAMFASLSGLSLGMQTPANSNLMAGQHYGYRKRLTSNARLGATIFDVTDTYLAMLDMLQTGRMLGLSSDSAGSGPLTVSLLGRQVRAATGAARLSHEAGALIVIVTSHPDGMLPRLQVHEPFGARDFATFEQVHAEIFARHAPALLAWPEAVENPLLRAAPSPEDEAEFGRAREQLSAARG
jgi:lauroyl/myristoyl acyltransferase